MSDGTPLVLHAARPGSGPATPVARRSYGMRILSDIDLPELDLDVHGAPDRTPDLIIRRHPVTLSAATRVRPMAELFGPEATDLWWQTVGGFHLPLEGRELFVDPLPGIGDDLVAYPLLGTVLALALHRRGQFTFHASAVSVGGRGVVMLGNKGAGKSTTAATLLAAGHPLVADDIVALDDDPHVPRLIPGFGQVKLDGAALQILCGPDSRARVDLRPPMDIPALAGKRRVLLPGGLAPAPVPTGLICLLARGPQARLVPLAAHEALQAVLLHAYVARFGTAALSGARAAHHFRRAAAIAGSGLVHILVVPDSLDRLPEAVAIIERHIAVLPPAEART